MSTKQELIDFQTAELAELDALIAGVEQIKLQKDIDIEQQQINIDNMNFNIANIQAEKVALDAQIAGYNVEKGKANEILTIIEAS
jgi:hypothetical protein